MFVSAGAQESQILFLHIKFEISKKEIRGYVALLMDIPSIDELRALIADFVMHLIEKTRTGNAQTSDAVRGMHADDQGAMRAASKRFFGRAAAPRIVGTISYG
jgi:hypothetical protein